MPTATRRRALRAAIVLAACLLACRPAAAGDQPQWGVASTRNMVSAERGLAASFDPATGANVNWVAALGSQTYSTPVVAGGRVLVGTNNDVPRDPRHKGDRAVLLCLDEADGRLLWQLVIPKISEDLADPFLDWKGVGFASPPSVEGDRAYTLTNRGEVVCLDMKGLTDGNLGPFTDEGRHQTPRGRETVEPSETDADVVWVCDLVRELGVRTHDQVQGSILIHGDLLYVNSCNGVDNTHRHIPSPDAPSLVVINKHTGKLVARDGLHLGPTTFHVNWCAPSLGTVGAGATPLLFFGGGDGVLYALDPLAPTSAADERRADSGLALLKKAWQFDPDPAAPKQDVHKWVGNRREGPSVIMGMPVVEGGRVYLTAGGDPWWGKQRGVLKCLELSISDDGKAAATPREVWSFPLPRETCSTPAVHDGMVFVTDVGGHVHCVDAATGKGLWTHKAVGEFWASPLVADGKLYAGTRRGQFVVLAAARELEVIAKVDVDEPIHGTAVAANGVVYVAAMKHLYAVKAP